MFKKKDKETKDDKKRDNGKSDDKKKGGNPFKNAAKLAKK